MFVIFGTRGRSHTIGSGTFFCPREGGDRPYEHKEARRWFTLFFIPLIPLDRPGDYVECTSCKSTYYTTVLEAPTGASIQDVMTQAIRYVAVRLTLADGHVDPDERRVATEVVRSSPTSNTARPTSPPTSTSSTGPTWSTTSKSSAASSTTTARKRSSSLDAARCIRRINRCSEIAVVEQSRQGAVDVGRPRARRHRHRSEQQLGRLVAQHAAQDLARGRLGDLVDELDDPDLFVGGDMLRHEVHDLVRVAGLPASARRTPSGAPRLLVGHRDHGGVAMLGWVSSSASSSAGGTWKPLYLMSSLSRSTM